MRRKLCIFGLALAFQLPQSISFGQQAPSYVAHRPSDVSPSVNINNIGGYNTRARLNMSLPGLSDYGNSSIPQFGSGASAASYARAYQASRSQALFNPSGSVMGLPNSPGVPSDYGKSQAGRFVSPDLRGRSPVQNAADQQTLSLVSGLTEATSEYTPLLGWEKQTMELPPSAYFAPQYGDTPFHQFFQLHTAAQAAPPPAGTPLPSMSAMLEQHNDARARQLLDQALQLFKLGTTRTQPERMEQLRRAQGLLEAVAKLDRKNVLAPLLAAHVSMARDEIYQAARNLLEAVDRDFQVLSAQKDLSGYYGDPALLTELLQSSSILRAGDASGAGEGYVVQAYAAWLQGDAGRVALALERMQRSTVAGGQRSIDRMQRFVFSIKAAMN